MGLSSIRQFLAVLLAVLVIVGLSLSVVLAGDMAMKMSVGAGIADSGHGDCCDGGGGDAGKIKTMTCAPICAPPVAAMSSEVAPLVVVETGAALVLPEDEFRNGALPPPDPYPPRSADIG
jgi:hypothetical protein